MVRKKTGYDADDIKVLTDREHVRLRTQVYLGNTTMTAYEVPSFIDNSFTIKEVEFIPAVYKAVGEIIDNSIDEFAKTFSLFHHINIKANPVLHEGIDEKVFTWVNSSLLFDGGICNTQFLNAFYDAVGSHLVSSAKRAKCKITKNDIKQNLLVIGNLRLSNPEYDAQSKTRLTGPNLRKEMSNVISSTWATFTRRNKDWLNEVLERSIIRHHNFAD